MATQTLPILMNDLYRHLVPMYPSGKILSFSVPVDESLAWEEAIRLAAPETQKELSIWKVGDQYPSRSNQEMRTMILVNFGVYLSSNHVLAWAHTPSLIPITPRECFALGIQYPFLNHDLGMDYMSLVSLDACVFQDDQQVCNLWFDESRRKAHLNLLNSIWHSMYWFVFVHANKNVSIAMSIAKRNHQMLRQKILREV